MKATIKQLPLYFAILCVYHCQFDGNRGERKELWKLVNLFIYQFIMFHRNGCSIAHYLFQGIKREQTLLFISNLIGDRLVFLGSLHFNSIIVSSYVCRTKVSI